MIIDLFGIRLVRRRRVTRKPSVTSRRDYLANKEAARAIVTARLDHFNAHYQLSYNRVSIKNTLTKWGSCSSRKNLNFSYKIVFLSTELQDYLVVHELCHLKEMNHGASFWNLVGKTVPDYQALNKKLRKISMGDLK